MNANQHFEDDDLALYAMHLLAEPEASAVARSIAEDIDTRKRFAEVQATLGIYAQASVEMHEIPEGSNSRLMARIAQHELPIPSQSIPIRSRHSPFAKALPWVGWALAAGLTFAAGVQYRDRTALHKTLEQEVAQAADQIEIKRERDDLRAKLSQETSELLQLRSSNARINTQAADLRKKHADQAVQVAQAAQQEEALGRTIAIQEEQIAQSATSASRDRLVLDALQDPAALRVTLTKPKSKPAPTGKATYIAGRGTLVFFASNLAPLKTNKVYQLWLMPSDGSSPIPAGTFVPDSQGNANIVSAQFVHPVSAKGFAVTIENQGGSQTPTLPLILAGI